MQKYLVASKYKEVYRWDFFRKRKIKNLKMFLKDD